MRAVRVVVADGGSMPRAELSRLIERFPFDVVAEAVSWVEVHHLVGSKAADLVLIAGDPDFALGASELACASIAVVPDAAAAKDYANGSVFAVISASMEPEMISSVASLAVARAEDLATARTEIVKVRDQLEGRKLVERAKGVLMRRLGISEDAAYRKMQRASQEENRKMSAIAESILSAERLYAEPVEPPT